MHSKKGSPRSALLFLPLLGAILLVFSLTAGATVVYESGTDYVIEPEYERTMQKVLLTLETSTEDLASHRNIIKSLPGYTEIIMLTPEKRAKSMRHELEKMGAARNVRLVPFATGTMDAKDAFVLSTVEQRIKPLEKNIPIPRGTIWAQDLFEAATDPEGHSVLLTPFIHKIFIQKNEQKIDDWNDGLFADNRFISKLEGEGVSTRSLPVVFKGGNVLVDRFKGARLAFVGGDVIRETIVMLNRTMGRAVGEEEVVESLKQYLKVEQVEIIGRDDHQPLKMFHLDQAMVLLGSGVAGVTRVVGVKAGLDDHNLNDVEQFLTKVRATLVRLGYTIIDIDATVGDVLNYRYYVNGVAYINKLTKQREYLFPLFDTSLTGSNREIYLGNIRRIESLGYRVLPVATDSNHRHGGLHCMVNVIS